MVTSINDLPNELVYIIFENLLPSGRVCLGLTCKRFYAIFKERQNALASLMEPACCARLLRPNFPILDERCGNKPCQYQHQRLHDVLQTWRPLNGYRFSGQHIFKFLKTSIYGMTAGSPVEKTLGQRYKDFKDAREYRECYAEFMDDTSDALPNPYRMSGADWNAVAKEMMKNDMERWDCFNDWNYFWRNFDVYRRYRYTFEETIAGLRDVSRWNR